MFPESPCQIHQAPVGYPGIKEGKPMLRDETIRRVLQFRDDRDWRPFHTPKDLAISLSLEAAELLELFQ